jgi:hypothetical protein
MVQRRCRSNAVLSTIGILTRVRDRNAHRHGHRRKAAVRSRLAAQADRDHFGGRAAPSPTSVLAFAVRRAAVEHGGWRQSTLWALVAPAIGGRKLVPWLWKGCHADRRSDVALYNRRTPNPVTRRRFMKVSSAATTAMAAASCFTGDRTVNA